MCGIAGYYNPEGFNYRSAMATLEMMTGTITHRGPDSSGHWVDAKAGIALGHRRLSVVDVTSAGHQPMLSENGRYVLIYNGEIYNHKALREKLGTLHWRGHSDTETLLMGIQEWGLERTLKQAIGMFAIALWDRDTRTLFLARDRMGEKPLYYGWQGKEFLFGSELKALSKNPSCLGEVDRSSLALYVKRGYIPAPNSIYTGISKMIPGTILEITAQGKALQPKPYWSLSQVIYREDNQQYIQNPAEAVAALESSLIEAIKRQQIADVPLGAFLSGGIDSSTVVALMQSLSPTSIKTFTIGFNELEFNEAAQARSVAEYLKTDHTELYVSADDAMATIPSLSEIYDEPFADASQIPTILVSRLAREQVTVVLSGDGGDELFCGYGRYSNTINTWETLSKIPLSLRQSLKYILPDGKLVKGVSCGSLDALYDYIHHTQWKGYSGIVVGAAESNPSSLIPSVLSEANERMMYTDTLNYLPDDILVKVDRAAMSASLETRIPLLDHEVVELAWRLPISIKYRNGINKWPLKQILYKYVPENLVNRPKMGFGVPLGSWLRGPLRDWAETLLSEERIKRDGYFDPKPIREEWKRHTLEVKDRHVGLWTILMFQAWYNNA